MEIKNAILHIIKNDGNPSVYSESELDIDSEVCEAFISKHVKKLWNNPAAREAVFKSESAVYQALQSYIKRETSFKDLSRFLGERLTEILSSRTDVPPADLMIVRFDLKGDQFLALFKLNYNECFTHEVGGASNNLVKCQIVLPFTGGKVEEACLIPFNPMLIKLIESNEYFSELFLECEATLSRKETAQIINEVTDEFVYEYFNGDIKIHSSVKAAMMEEAEEADGILSMDNVAARAFEDESTKQDFIHNMREAGIIEDMPLGTKFAKQQFGTRRLKAENGIEIKFPVEFANRDDIIEIVHHNDDSVTLTIKRLRVNG